MKRGGSADEVAHAILWLLSDDASFTTGSFVGCLGGTVGVRSLLAPIALSVSTVLAGLSGLHVYWAFGGQGGRKGAIPELDGKPLFRPGRAATLGVAILLAVAGTLVLGRAAVGPHLVPPAVSLRGTRGVAAALIGRAIGDFNHVGFFKRRKTTAFAGMDARLYSPLALVLGLGAGIVAWGGGP